LDNATGINNTASGVAALEQNALNFARITPPLPLKPIWNDLGRAILALLAYWAGAKSGSAFRRLFSRFSL